MSDVSGDWDDLNLIGKLISYLIGKLIDVNK